MRSSSLGAILLAVLWGCAHSAATPPTPAPVARSAPAPVHAGRGGSSGNIATSPVQPDPTEAITPRELASIPDPVPGGASSQGKAPPAPERPAADPPAARPAAEGAAVASVPEPGDGRRWIWRVQLFASPDLAQADRIAKEASARFAVPYVIEFEGALYKVRLGSFETEALAQTLRERAVQEGFPGAFRMRSEAPVANTAK
jgi:peptidoglycan lytic transglycosylase